MGNRTLQTADLLTGWKQGAGHSDRTFGASLPYACDEKAIQETLQGGISLMKFRYEIKDFGDNRELRLRGDWTRATPKDAPREHIDRVSLNGVNGWRTSGDLSFLSLLCPIRKLRIYWLRRISLRGLTALTDLHELQLHLYAKLKIPFDFGELPSLRNLDIWWNRGFTGLRQLHQVERLSVNEIFGVPELDFSGLSNLKSLEIVTGRGVKNVRLAGVRRLEELTLIGLSNLQNVIDFEAGTSIRRLRIEGLKTIEPSFLKKFTNLETVATRARDPIEKADFGRPPKSLLKLPI